MLHSASRLIKPDESELSEGRRGGWWKAQTSSDRQATEDEHQHLYWVIPTGVPNILANLISRNKMDRNPSLVDSMNL